MSDEAKAHKPKKKTGIIGKLMPVIIGLVVGAAGVVERLATSAIPGVEVTLLRGNHEELLLSFLDDPSKGTLWRQLGCVDTLLSYGINVFGEVAQHQHGNAASHLHVFHRAAHFSARVIQGLAVFERDGAGQFFKVLFHQRFQFDEALHALGGGYLPPFQVGLVGRLRRLIHLGG